MQAVRGSMSANVRGSLRIRLITCLALAGSMLGCAQTVDVLSTLRKNDARYAEAFSAEGEVVVGTTPRGSTSASSRMHWNYSAANSDVGVIMEAAGLPTLSHEAMRAELANMRPTDPNTPAVTFPRRTHVSFRGQHIAGEIEEYVAVTLDSKDREDIAGTPHELSLSAPDSSVLALSRLRILFSMGRGFGEYIDEVTINRTISGGLIEVIARGRTSANDKGIWRLTVDPKRNYIVRAASFTSSRSAEPWLVMTNDGTRRNGDCYYPETATWQTYPTELFPRYEFTMTAASFDKDAQVLARAEKAISPPYPAKTTLEDYRVSPTRIVDLDDAKKQLKRETRNGF
jgi:hypothetical protein